MLKLNLDDGTVCCLAKWRAPSLGVAMLFNTFFKKVPSNIVGNTEISIYGEMVLYQLIYQEFYDLLLIKLNNSKSDPGRVPSILVKRVLYLLVRPLWHLICVILSESVSQQTENS